MITLWSQEFCWDWNLAMILACTIMKTDVSIKFFMHYTIEWSEYLYITQTVLWVWIYFSFESSLSSLINISTSTYNYFVAWLVKVLTNVIVLLFTQVTSTLITTETSLFKCSSPSFINNAISAILKLVQYLYSNIFTTSAENGSRRITTKNWSIDVRKRVIRWCLYTLNDLKSINNTS